MSTLTEIVAAVVMHSSAAALSHFGVAVEPAQTEKAQPAPAAQRSVARTRRPDKVNVERVPAVHRSVARA